MNPELTLTQLYVQWLGIFGTLLAACQCLSKGVKHGDRILQPGHPPLRWSAPTAPGPREVRAKLALSCSPIGQRLGIWESSVVQDRKGIQSSVFGTEFED